MTFLHWLARVLRLPSPILRPFANDVSVLWTRLRDRREAGHPTAPTPTAGTSARGPWSRRAPGIALLITVLLGTVIGLVLIAPPATAAAAITMLQIALLRITDVMFGVFRTTFIVRGRTLAAAMAAFGESATWISAAGIVLADLTVARGLAFATGVAIGTALGVIIVRNMRLGLVTVRVFAPLERGHEIAERVRAAGQGATLFPGEGRDGPVAMILSVMRRREADDICRPFVDDPQLYVSMDAGMGPASRGRAGEV